MLNSKNNLYSYPTSGWGPYSGPVVFISAINTAGPEHNPCISQLGAKAEKLKSFEGFMTYFLHHMNLTTSLWEFCIVRK